MNGGNYMKRVLYVALATTLLIMITNMAYGFECQAEKRSMTSEGLVVKQAALEVAYQTENYNQRAVDIGKAHYSVHQDGTTVTAMITLGPNYDIGNLSKGAMSEDGALKLSFVTPKVTYILTCQE
jgi:hypothetical protein